ncbi:pyridoxamine 5'-phosphate oxidase [Sandaracinus amylolyticus]|uniref:Pyridoxamine 5'-phosphate oxidase n=1 Tax=Sandaracinus amylolyticus TaxID=927083 RepID=A0A0F6SGH3_9BACT|nr:pyridoxamine 5'-phosphate oxidase [Sandaracinus amylolyticus]AKF08694.1 Pyridoxamine 5'-phosphate oxidase [Sandaracinus amylolyticus]
MSSPVPDPIALFLETRSRAEPNEPWDAVACALATADAKGRPSARFVLVKEVDADGFWFYTNEQSQKGKDLDANPWASLCFFWPSVHTQFRIEGPVEKASAARSDAYFASRPRISQVGAWASDQSRPIASRETLTDRVRQLEAQFEGKPVPRPPHWGGYRVIPQIVEHWVEGDYRLHDRFRYERQEDGTWRATRLAP